MDQTFREYQLVTALARKTTSSLYLAQQETDSTKKVVIKFFNAIGTNFEQERFENESKQISHLRNPYIVPLLEAGFDEERPYLISAYVSGNSLRHRMMAQSTDPLPFDKAISTLVQIGQALAYAHAKNILHANLKPENILINNQGVALLTDFTPLCLMERYLHLFRHDLLHARSMPPEQLEGTYTQESDQYALGCLAYELLTRQPAFPPGDATTEQDPKPPIPLTQMSPDIPQHADAAVLKALAKEPSERHKSVIDFLEALTASSWDMITTPYPEDILLSTGKVNLTLPLLPPLLINDDNGSSTLPDNEITAKRQALSRKGPPHRASNSYSKRKKVAIGVGTALVMVCILLFVVGVLPRLLFAQSNATQSYQQETPTTSATTTAIQATPTQEPTATPTEAKPSPTVEPSPTAARPSPTVEPSPTVAQPPTATPTPPKPTPTSGPTPTPTPKCRCLLCLC